jgi:hypothetical protein
MHKTLLFSLLSIFVFSSSCSKEWMEDRLQGSWRLKTAERNSLLNWKTINTGYEDGRFEFLRDGDASYTRNQLSMNGDWWIRRVTDSYNNDNGDQDQKQRMALSIHLVDFTSQRTVNLEFDEMHYRGRNRFIATYESSGYRYRYEFVRY